MLVSDDGDDDDAIGSHVAAQTFGELNWRLLANPAQTNQQNERGD